MDTADKNNIISLAGRAARPSVGNREAVEILTRILKQANDGAVQGLFIFYTEDDKVIKLDCTSFTNLLALATTMHMISEELMYDSVECIDAQS